MITKPVTLSITVAFLLVSGAAYAGSSKEHEELEAGSCSDPNPGGGTDADRIIQNAINYAKSWCNGSGGVKRGHKKSHWTAQDEDGGSFCRVTGTIECHN